MSKSTDKNSSCDHWVRFSETAHVRSRFAACLGHGGRHCSAGSACCCCPRRRPLSRILYCFTALQKAIRQPTTATGEERGEWALKGGSLFPLYLNPLDNCIGSIHPFRHVAVQQSRQISDTFALGGDSPTGHSDESKGAVKGTQQSNRLTCNSKLIGALFCIKGLSRGA